MTLNYYLDKPKSEGDTAIYLFLRVGKQTIKLKTGQYINPIYWHTKADKNDNHVKRSYTGYLEFNNWLRFHKHDLHKLYNKKTEENPSLSMQELREAVADFFEKKEPTVATGFFEHFQTYIDLHVPGLTKGTMNKYRMLKRHLENFSKVKRYKLTFDTIDLNFFDKFKAYFVQDLKHTDNTVWKNITAFKTFMNWALDRDLHQNLTYRKFKAPLKEVEIIYLTEQELMALYNAELKDPKLAQVRDVFCFACFTGQRFSDVAKLRRSTIKGDRWILRTQKTDRPNQIPLNGFAMAILEKYKDAAKPLPATSNQHTNDVLKDLGEAVGINEPTTLTRRRGNERLTNTKPKHKFITTHTARRTFITLSLEKGMRPEVVMRISGHTNYSSFKKYIKISEKVTEQEMNQIWQLPVQMKVVS